MYNNPYNIQNARERIDTQIEQLKQMKEQLQMPSINQTFQLAPSSGIRHANSIDDVKREMVSAETPFFSSDMTILWLKETSGEIKTYELNQIVEKDEKDLKIDFLMAQIEELKKEVKHESETDIDKSITKPTKSKKSSDV